MPQLQSLPSELLLAIALHVPQPALNGLAHTCRRLNKVITPLLYKSVLWQGHHHARPFVWQQEHLPTERSVAHQADALVIPSSESIIFDLDAFTRTVLSSESLRSLVKSVDLRWDSVRCCLQALHLHLESFFPRYLPGQPSYRWGVRLTANGVTPRTCTP